MSKERKMICQQIDSLQKQLESHPKKVKAEIKQEILNEAICSDESRFTRKGQIKMYDKMISTTKKYSKKYGVDLAGFFSQIDSTPKEQSKRVKSIPKEFENFSKLYKSVLRLKRGLENGVKGEYEAYKTIKVLDDEIQLFQNLCVPFQNGTEEHDIIAITTRGIFTIEVKYFSARFVTITKQGLVSIGKNFVGDSSMNDRGLQKKRPQNVIEQAQRHKHSLRRLLKNTEFEGVPVYPVFVYSNDKCTVHDEELDQSNLCVCYRTGIENIILDEKRPVCLSKEKVYSLCSLLEYECAGIEERTYTLSVTESSFYEALAAFISLQVASMDEKRIKNEISKLKKVVNKIDKDKDEAIGLGVGFLLNFLSEL